MAAAKKKTLRKLDAHNAAMEAEHARLNAIRRQKAAGIECNDCETEMEFDNPGGGLMKDPTKVTCPNCGATGNKLPTPRV